MTATQEPLPLIATIEPCDGFLWFRMNRYDERINSVIRQVTGDPDAQAHIMPVYSFREEDYHLLVATLLTTPGVYILDGTKQGTPK